MAPPSHEVVLQLWREALERLFPHAVPDTATWSAPDGVAAVLSSLAMSGGARTFTPDGREAVLRSVVRADDPGVLELVTDGPTYVVRPSTLTFEGFEGHALTYLRLDLLPLGAMQERGGGLMSLADHARVRLDAGAIVWFADGSPFVRLATVREPAHWTADVLRDNVLSLQQTLMSETA